MKIISSLILLGLALNLYAQERRIVKFEDGSKLEYSLIFDDPTKTLKYSVSANISSIVLGTGAYGLEIIPFFDYSDKLRFDASIFFPISRPEPDVIDAFKNDVGSLMKGIVEFHPEVHYIINSKIVNKKMNLWLKTEGNTSYNTDIEYLKQKNFNFDAGIDYIQTSLKRELGMTDNGNYYMFGTSSVALSVGISQDKSYHYKVSVPDRGIRDFSRENKFFLKMLIGAPLSKNIAFVPDNKDDELIIDPTTGFEDPSFIPVGIRLGYEAKRYFARKPNVFVNWGFTLGAQPNYITSYSILSTSDLFYGKLRFGIGFGSPK